MKLWTLALCAALASGQTVLINAGGTQAGAFSSDHSYIGGAVYTDASLGPGQWKTQRYGTLFSYLITLPNGTYDVEIQMAEPNPAVNAAGKRVFTVAVNGSESPDLDLFQLAGLRGHYSYRTQARVSNETLGVAFRGKVGNAVVNAILISRSPRRTVTEKLSTPGAGVGAKKIRLQRRPVIDAPVLVYEGGWNPAYPDFYLIAVVNPPASNPTEFDLQVNYAFSATSFLQVVYTTEDQ